jgi:hypothetical protein
MITKETRPVDFKKELLEDVASKPVRPFRQIDIFQFGPEYGGDDFMRPDQDGDWLSAAGGYELNRTNELRVLVPDGKSAEDVIRGLKKAIKWLSKNPDILKDSYAGGLAEGLYKAWSSIGGNNNQGWPSKFQANWKVTLIEDELPF